MNNGFDNKNNIIKHIIDNDIEIDIVNDDDDRSNHKVHRNIEANTTLYNHIKDNAKDNGNDDVSTSSPSHLDNKYEIIAGESTNTMCYHTQTYSNQFKKWKCCSNSNADSEGCKVGSVRKYHPGNIMSNNNIYLWPITITIFLFCAVFELIMKLLILTMIFLLYVFEGKIQRFYSLSKFDSWNTFRYSLIPIPGKYDCCFDLYGSDGCTVYVKVEERDPVIDEVNKVLVFDKI